MPPKPQITRDAYPHVTPLPTRWLDNDLYGHVNNVLYYSFFDTAINRYLVSEGGLDIIKSPVIAFAVETQCQFMRPVAFPDGLEVGLRVGTLGRSSVRYELAIFKEGEPYAAAAGYFVHVFVERATQQSAPIPPEVRAALEKLQMHV